MPLADAPGPAIEQVRPVPEPVNALDLGPARRIKVVGPSPTALSSLFREDPTAVGATGLVIYGLASPPRSKWTSGVNPGEITGKLSTTFVETRENALKAQVDRLERRTDAELQALKATVSELKQAFDTTAHKLDRLFLGLRAPAPGEVDQHPEVASLIEAVTRNGTFASAAEDPTSLAQVLNYVADEGVPAHEHLVALAEGHLQAESPKLRAAAARALAALDPARARRVLPAAIDAEESRLAKAVMRGALISASL